MRWSQLIIKIIYALDFKWKVYLLHYRISTNYYWLYHSQNIDCSLYIRPHIQCVKFDCYGPVAKNYVITIVVTIFFPARLVSKAYLWLMHIYIHVTLHGVKLVICSRLSPAHTSVQCTWEKPEHKTHLFSESIILFSCSMTLKAGTSTYATRDRCIIYKESTERADSWHLALMFFCYIFVHCTLTLQHLCLPWTCVTYRCLSLKHVM